MIIPPYRERITPLCISVAFLLRLSLLPQLLASSEFLFGLSICLPLSCREVLLFVDPDFDADLPVSRIRFGKTCNRCWRVKFVRNRPPHCFPPVRDIGAAQRPKGRP